MITNNFNDSGHCKAIEYCIKHALYNKALFAWQQNPKKIELPQPEAFSLKSQDIEAKEQNAIKQLEEFDAKCKGT